MRYNAKIDLVCDVDAGIGYPGPVNNYTNFYRPPCNYQFKWRSLYACPKCRKQDFEKVIHPCVNGTAKVTIVRKVPCWGSVDGMDISVNYIKCAVTTSPTPKVSPTTTARVITGSSKEVFSTTLLLKGVYE